MKNCLYGLWIYTVIPIFGKVVSTSEGLAKCKFEQEQCKDLLSTSDVNWVPSPVGCDAKNVTKCVLCLTSECSYDDNYEFQLPNSIKTGNCSALAENNPEYHISGKNGYCDNCGKEFHLYVLDTVTENVEYSDLFNKVKRKLNHLCTLRGRFNGATISYGTNRTKIEGNYVDQLYVDSIAPKDFLDIEVDIKVYAAVFIAAGSVLVAVLSCLFSHTPFMIENSICHKNFLCYRWSHWICACCPRDFLKSSCSSCRKPKQERYQRLSGRSDSARSRLNSSRSQSGKTPTTKGPTVRFQYDNIHSSQLTYASGQL